MGPLLRALLAFAICFSSSDALADIPCPVAPKRPYVGWGGKRVLVPPSGKPVPVYVIFYGAIPSSTQSQMRDFISHLGGTPYWNTLSVYTDSGGHHVPNAITLAGTRLEGYYPSGGHSFDDDNVADYVSEIVKEKLLPHDSNAVYGIFFAEDVKVTHKGSQIPSASSGAYHKWTGKPLLGHDGNPSDLHYAVIPHPNSNPTPKVPTNADNGTAQTWANWFAHELAETITDPEDDGWQSDYGNIEMVNVCENCPFMPVTVDKTVYNLQQMMSFDGGDRRLGFCAFQLPCSAPDPCANGRCGVSANDSCGRPHTCGCTPGKSCEGGTCRCPALDCGSRSCGSIADACGNSKVCGASCPKGLLCVEGHCGQEPPPTCPCGGKPPACRACQR